MSIYAPEYDELYVVSDLHLGGYDGAFVNQSTGEEETRDYRIFRCADALAWLFEEIRLRARSDGAGKIALVLNGDIVDFLAMKDACYFNTDGAPKRLREIIEDPKQGKVWSALQSFVKEDVADLVMVLGNHDVELGLPEVRNYLESYLTDDNPSARARIVFSMEGEGFRCDVGKSRVLCVHGNEVDLWNIVDHGQIARIGRAKNQDRTPPAWPTNAGTTLVIDVMNEIKKRFQWIDLLKPEKEAATYILAALDKRLVNKLEHISEIARRAGRDYMKREAGFLSVDESALNKDAGPNDEEKAHLDRLYAAAELSGRDDSEAVDAILDEALDNLADKKEPVDLLDAGDETLGIRDAFSAVAGFVKTAVGYKDAMSSTEGLRQVLQENLAWDTSYSPTSPDDTFKDLDELVGPGIDFLVAGHTHFEKVLDRTSSRGYYFNSGSWITLMKLPLELLDNKELFTDRLLGVLEDGSIEKLENPEIEIDDRPVELVHNIRTVVRIAKLESGGTQGCLMRVQERAAGEEDAEGGFEFSWDSSTKRTVDWR
ncbi:MAG: hypothetical protein GY854_14335 [Deltaproteobacteria bacterium]|nr:hypothetical protein [Deltaproteobacteria bacterium]